MRLLSSFSGFSDILSHPIFALRPASPASGIPIKTTEARDFLAPVYGWFTEGFDTPDQNDAKALLDQLS